MLKLDETDQIGSQRKETTWEDNLPDELDPTRDESKLPDISTGFGMELEGFDEDPKQN